MATIKNVAVFDGFSSARYLPKILWNLLPSSSGYMTYITWSRR